MPLPASPTEEKSAPCWSFRLLRLDDKLLEGRDFVCFVPCCVPRAQNSDQQIRAFISRKINSLINEEGKGIFCGKEESELWREKLNSQIGYYSQELDNYKSY